MTGDFDGDEHGGHRPALLRIRPARALIVTLVLVTAVWATVAAVSSANVTPAAYLASSIEWVLLALSVVVAGYAAGRLSRRHHPQVASSFLLMSVLLAMLLVYRAGAGPSLRGIDRTVLGDVLITVAAAAVLVGVLGCARHIWGARAARGYAVTGLVLVGVSVAGTPLAGSERASIAVGAVMVPAVGCLVATVLAYLRSDHALPAYHDDEARWPRLLRLSPGRVLLTALAVLVVMMAAVVVVDIADAGGYADDMVGPIWQRGYNHGPVEVAQWLFLALAVAAASYLAGRLANGRTPGGSFFLVLSLGLALMLVEDVGDVRYLVSDIGIDTLSGTVFGSHTATIMQAPMYGLLALLMVYALRFGKPIFRVRAARWYLLAAYGFYGVSQLGSVLARVDYVYHRLGSVVNTWLFAGQLPPVRDRPAIDSSGLIIDAMGEESFELIGVACMLAMIVAFAASVRTSTATPPLAASPQPELVAFAEREVRQKRMAMR